MIAEALASALDFHQSPCDVISDRAETCFYMSVQICFVAVVASAYDRTAKYLPHWSRFAHRPCHSTPGQIHIYESDAKCYSNFIHPQLRYSSKVSGRSFSNFLLSSLASYVLLAFFPVLLTTSGCQKRKINQ